MSSIVRDLKVKECASTYVCKMGQRVTKLCSKLLPGSVPMIEHNHDEERLARVERMLAQCRKEAAALKVIAASRVVVVVVDALGATRTIKPAKPKRSH